MLKHKKFQIPQRRMTMDNIPIEDLPIGRVSIGDDPQEVDYDDELCDCFNCNYDRDRDIVINGEITPDLIDDVAMRIVYINKIDNWDDIPVEERQPIRIYFNSVGGDLSAGNTLINIIESSATMVIGIAIGYVYSMALPIFLSCHLKLAYSNSSYLIHDGLFSYENSGSKFADMFKFIMKQEEKLKQYIVDHTKITRKQLEKNWSTEWFFDAEQAMELGVVDEIVDCIV
jgi:ATP-dependent Clp protease protease subunit